VPILGENVNLLDIARRRKTTRSFKKGEIPPLNDILEAIEVALEAPSGLNCQPWYFLIVSDSKIKKKIRKFCEHEERLFHEIAPDFFKEWLKKRKITWKKKFLTDAPYLILVFSDMKCPYAIQSTWLSIGYLLLALEDKELSSLTYTPPNTSRLRNILGIDRRYSLQTIIPVGYPKKEKMKEERKKIEEKVYFNKWGKSISSILDRYKHRLA